MAEDLSVSDLSFDESEGEEIPTEFFEKAEMMLLNKDFQNKELIEQTKNVLDEEVFNDSFFEEKGFSKELLKKRIFDRFVEACYIGKH